MLAKRSEFFKFYNNCCWHQKCFTVTHAKQLSRCLNSVPKACLFILLIQSKLTTLKSPSVITTSGLLKNTVYSSLKEVVNQNCKMFALCYNICQMIVTNAKAFDISKTLNHVCRKNVLSAYPGLQWLLTFNCLVKLPSPIYYNN